MAKTPNKRYGSWVKNFGKSTTFAAKDILTGITPNISSTASNVGSDISELRKTLKNIKNDKKAILNFLLGEDENFSEYASLALKNAKSSLRTGKFIDQKRADDAMNKAMGFDDSDFDFDTGDNDDDPFGADDFDSNDQSFSSVEMGADKIANKINANNAIGFSALNSNIGRTNTTIAQGFNNLDKSNKQLFSMSLAISEKHSQIVQEKLGNINESLSAIVTFNNETLSPFVQGSLKYYDDSLALFNQMNESLTIMSRGPAGKSNSEFKDNTYEGVFGSDGFSLKGYAKQVANNARSSLSNSPLGMLSFLNNPMVLAEFAANPLGSLLSFGLSSLIPAKLKNSLGRTDNLFKQFMPAALSKIATLENSDNPLLSLFGSLFGLKQTKGYDKFKTGDYERGPIPFDGQTKKAIVEVIPSYLSKIAYTLDKIAEHKGISGFDNPSQVIFDWSDDYETGGKFVSSTVLKERERKKRRSLKLSGMSEVQSDFNDTLNGYYGYGSKKGSLYKSKFEDYLEYLVDSGEMYNPKTADSGLRKFFKSDEELTDIKRLLGALTKASLMQMAGSGVYEGRAKLAEYYHGNANLGGSRVSGNRYMAENRVMNPIMVAGYSNNYYKGDSSSGIVVNASVAEDAPINQRYSISKEDLSRYNKRYNTKFTNINQVIKHYDSLKFDSQIDSEAKINQKAEKIAERNLRSAYNKYKKENPDKAMSFEQFREENFESIRNKAYSGLIRKNKSVYGEETDNTFSGAIGKLFKSPIKYVEGALRKIDNTMYRIIFGGENDEESIFGTALKGIRKTFDKTIDFLHKDVVEPFKKMLFGENIKESKWYKAAKEFLDGKILGEKNKKGQYEGGILSDTVNGTKNFFRHVRREYNLWLKPKFKEILNDMRQYIFGEDEKDENGKAKKKEPFMDRMMKTIYDGFGQWTSMLFGKNHNDPKENEKSAKYAAGQFKKAIPKGIKGMLAGGALGTLSGMGGFGLLGSLFLPGGPIGGAIVGGAVGLLHQSENFKNFLYGKEVTKVENGKQVISKVGGLIPDKVQKFFSKNRIPILGGAAFGLGKTLLLGGGVGLIPSIAVGVTGPVIAGSAWGLAMHSKAMQDAIFGKETGEKDEKGKAKRLGGLMNNKMAKTLKKVMPRSLAGAITSVAGFTVLGELGIVGSALALGPIPAAIAGAAAGIASSSDKLVHAIFGYHDDKGNYHSGMMDKLSNLLSVNVFKPFTLFMSKEIFKTKGWFLKKIAYPIADAVMPLKVGFQKFGDSIMSHLNRLFEGIGRNFNEIFGRISQGVMNVFNTIMKPIRFLASGLFKSILAITKHSTEAMLTPLKIAGALADKTLKYQAYRDSVKNAKNRWKDAWNSGTFGDLFNATGNLSDRLFDRRIAYADDKYAKQLSDYDEAKAKRDREFNEKYNAGLLGYAQKAQSLKDERKALKERKWDLSPEEYEARKKQIENAEAKNNIIGELQDSTSKEDVIQATQINHLSRIEEHVAKISSNTDPETVQDAHEKAVEEAQDKKDDNAVSAAAARKAEAAKNELAENAFRQTTLMEDLRSIWLGEDKDAKKGKRGGGSSFASRALSKINGALGFAGNIGRGVLGLGRSLVGLSTSFASLIGIVGGIATALGLFFDSKRDGDIGSKIADSDSMGYLARRGTRKIADVGVGLYGLAKRSLTESKAGRWVTSVTKDIGKKINEKLFEKTGRMLGKAVPEIAEGNVDSWKGYAEKAMEHISKTIDESTFLAPLKAVKDKIRDMFKSICNFIYKDKTIRKKLMQSVSAVMKKTAKYAVRYIGGIASLGGLTAAFAAYDGITGFAEASNMFDVAPEDVDMRMRGVSTLVNVIFGLPLPPITIIDIGLSLGSTGIISFANTDFGKLLQSFGLNLEGYDHRKIICQLIYKMISDDTENDKLAQNQQKLEAEYNNYLKEKGLTSDQMSMDDYVNDVRDNGTLWDRYGAPLIRRVLGIEQKQNGEKPKTFMEMVSHDLSKLADSFKDMVKGFVSSIVDFSFTDFVKTIFGISPDKSFGDVISDAGNSLSDWASNLKNTAMKRWFGSGSGGDSSGMTKSLNKTKEIAGSMEKAGTSFSDKLGSLFGSQDFSGGGGIAPTETNYKVGGDDSGIPYYWSQLDPQIRYKQVFKEDSGFGNFGDYGCAPTSLAMVASMYNGYPIDPLDAAQYIEKGDVSYGDGFFSNTVKGIKESYFGHAAKSLGLNMTRIEDNEISQGSILNHIQQGQAVILGGRRFGDNSDTPFTSQGHYVVVAGASKENKNKVFVYDPLGRSGMYDATTIFDDALSIGGFAAAFNHASGAAPEQSERKEARIQESREKLNGKSVNGTAIVQRARDYIAVHTPYDLNSNGGAPGIPTSCAKFVTDVYRDCGLDLANNTNNVEVLYEFFKELNGITSDDGKPEPGDIVIWDSYTIRGNQGGRCAHVGICTGNGKGVIHAGSSTGVVEKSDYTTCMGSDFTVNCICKCSSVPGTAKYTGNGYTYKNKREETGFMKFIGELTKSLTGVAKASWNGEKWTPEAVAGAAVSGIGTTAEHKKVYKYLKNHGYSDSAIAGIMGNIQQESSFNSSDVDKYYVNGVEHGGIGLFQWAHPSRQQKLKDFANSIGKSYTDPETQLAFMLHEVDNSYHTVSPSSLNGLSPEEAAAKFNSDYEGGSETGKRQSYARQFMNKIQAGEFSGAGGKIIRHLNDYVKRNNNSFTKYKQIMNYDSGLIKDILPDCAEYNKINPGDDLTVIRSKLNAQIKEAGLRARTSIVPSKSALDGNNASDIIAAIRSIDNHAEMREMIAYLKVIAEYGTGGSTPIGNRKEQSNRSSKLKNIARDLAKSSTNMNKISQERINQLMDTDGKYKDLSKSEYELAYQIAKGGNFRK